MPSLKGIFEMKNFCKIHFSVNPQTLGGNPSAFDSIKNQAVMLQTITDQFRNFFERDCADTWQGAFSYEQQLDPAYFTGFPVLFSIRISKPEGMSEVEFDNLISKAIRECEDRAREIKEESRVKDRPVTSLADDRLMFCSCSHRQYE